MSVWTRPGLPLCIRSSRIRHIVIKVLWLNQAWAMHAAQVSMAHGLVYRAAVVGRFSRRFQIMARGSAMPLGNQCRS